jgi:hypothetical protein
MGTGVSFPRGKARPGRDADHSPPSSAEVKYVAGQLYFFLLKKISTKKTVNYLIHSGTNIYSDWSQIG